MSLYIKMLPLIKLHTRRFHFTSKFFLRRIMPKTSSSNVEKDYLSNELDPPFCEQTSSPDYLGIESDEGVIIVKPQKYPLLQTIQPSRKPKEKFHCTTFGVVRYDTDNTPKFHGQYGKKHDFIFPHTASENAEVVKFIKKSNNRILDRNSTIDQSLNWIKKSSAYDEIKTSNPQLFEKKNQETNLSDDNCYFNSHTMENFDRNNIDPILSNDSNFIDKEYFGVLSTSEKKFVGEQNASETDISEREELLSVAKSDQDLNYFDECYFGNSKTEDFGDNNIQPASKDLSFIDEDYFRTSNTSENISISKQNSSENIITKNENYGVFNERDVASEDNKAATNNLSFLEENYSGDFAVSRNEKSKSKEFPENAHFSDNTSQFNAKNLSDINNDEYFKKNFKSSDDKDIKCNDLLNSSATSSAEISDSLLQDMIHRPYTENKFHEIDNESFKQNSKKFSQDKLEKSRYSFKHEVFPNKTEQSSVIDMESDISNDLHITALKSLKKNDFKYSQVTSEESNQDDQISTAHDFVQKIRKEQDILNQNINKGMDKSKEKVDSKGFRILKNQVPDLSHFTRDEILNILMQNIVYSDDELLVLNKPYNLVMHESQTTKDPCLSVFLDDLARQMDPKSTNPKLFTVHRLDKETTGCLLLARTEIMAQTLKSLFAQRKLIKTYWIITTRVPDPEEGVIDIPISEGTIDNKKRMVLHPKLPKDIVYQNHSKKGKSAVTSYKVLSQSGNAALVEAIPVTGLKHQIRVHFGFGLGCPILGDHKYSYVDKLVPQKLPSDILQKLYIRQSKVRHIPMHIHAKSVVIPNYFEDRNLRVNIPLPEHMKVNLKSLKFRKKDMKT